MLPYELPLIPGWDLAGVVDTTGPGVAHWMKGEAVFAYAPLTRNGAYAQYIVVHESDLAPKPPSMDYIHAAAVPIAGLTAWQALFEIGKLTTGQRVLIHAAAGGVGSMAVQLARWKGAHVIGTASGQNREFVESLGANEVIDYTENDFASGLRDVDLVFDTVGGDTQTRSWSTLRPGGILVASTVPPSAETAERHGVRTAMVQARPDAVGLIELGKLIDEGHLKILVEHELPLSEAAQAQRLSQSGHGRGKIVLHIS
jgi:NADPH:quinone reductase-like Zn-dependent oxidoreductase